MTASLLNSDTDSTNEVDVEQHKQLQNTDRKFSSLLIDGMITFLIKWNNSSHKFLFWWSGNVFFEHYFDLKPSNKYVR